MKPTSKYDRVPVSMLHELFRYEPDTGRLFWRYRDYARKEWNTRYADTEIKCPAKGGYFMAGIKFNKKSTNYLVHRIAWAMMTGAWPDIDKEIDHIDGDRQNNKWVNLRIASPRQNRMNNNVCRAKSGFKGVYVPNHVSKVFAGIRVNGRNINLGYFDDPKDAARAYDSAAVKYFGEFAKTNADLGLL